MLQILQNTNDKWYTIKSKVKVETNDVPSSKSSWLLVKVFWIYYM